MAATDISLMATGLESYEAMLDGSGLSASSRVAFKAGDFAGRECI